MYMSPEMLEGRPYNEKVELPAAASNLATQSRMDLHSLVHSALTQHNACCQQSKDVGTFLDRVQQIPAAG